MAICIRSMEPKDNIAHVDDIDPAAPPAGDTPNDSDALVEKFDQVQALIMEQRATLDAVGNAQGLANKIEALRLYALRSQQQNETMYDLLVEMNNFFGKPM